MAKKNSKKNPKNKPARKQAAAVTKARDMSLVSKYIQLLSDPCAGPLTNAPYAGLGSGYLVRTVDQLNPIATGVNASQVDFVYEFTPWNTPSAFVGGATSVGGNVTTSITTVSNFVTTSTVRAYRPVAACLKWVPFGAYSARSGVIGASYSPAKMIANAATINPANRVGQQQHVALNGSEPHEILWLPSFNDERFGSNAESNINGVGSITIIGRGIDATAAPNSSANGYLEATVVWEWLPDESTSATGGIVPNVTSSGGVPLNQVLGSIRDAAGFVFQKTGHGMGMGAVLAGQALLTRGWGTSYSRGAAMPRIQG